MKQPKRQVRTLSSAEEKRIQAGIAADPDNPEWTAHDFRRAKPFAKAFPSLAKSRHGPGSQRKPTKGGRVVATYPRGGGTVQGRWARLAVAHGRGAEEGGRAVAVVASWPGWSPLKL